MTAFPTDPADPRWGVPGWPDWVQGFRPHQITAVTEIMEHYASGADVVILNAPTGAGKTIIAEAVRRLLGVSRGTYVANTNSLVDQFMRDFSDYARMLKGRSNYPTLNFPQLFGAEDAWGNGGASCADCNVRFESTGEVDDNGKDIKGLVCSMCSSVNRCPYRVAKTAALGRKKNGQNIGGAAVAVTNTAYFLAEANGPGSMSGRDFVVVDEADTLEQILMGQLNVTLSKSRLKKLSIGQPARKTVEEAWLPWAEEECLPALTRWVAEAETHCKTSNPPVKRLRDREQAKRLLSQVTDLVAQLRIGNAVYDGYEAGDVEFKPIRVNHLAPSRLWAHAPKWLLMSATIIDPNEFVTSLGIEEAGLSWEIVNVPSTFPAENRPIYVRPVANMVYKEKEAEWPKLAKGIRDVLERHPDERVLVHTVSYALSTFLARELRTSGRPVTMYAKASERERVLEQFKRTRGGVLLASSMDRGVDLPEDECRVVIVTKMPYMSLKDKQVARRMYQPNGQLWYSVQTIRSLVQMTGRHVRSADDIGYTYILDRQFVSNIWRSSKHLLPPWWSEALDWTGGK